MRIVNHGATVNTAHRAGQRTAPGQDVIDEPTMLADSRRRDCSDGPKALDSSVWIYRHSSFVFRCMTSFSFGGQIEFSIGLLHLGIRPSTYRRAR